MYYSDTLQHHGILGMKWGVRRYQNKDGSLTAEGKARQNSSSDGNGSESKNMSTSSSSKSNVTKSSSSTTTTTKSVSEMTIEELKAITERNNAEANYYKSQKVLADAKSSNTTASTKSKSKVAKFTSNFADKTVESVTNGITKAIGNAAKSETTLILEKYLDIKITDDNKKKKKKDDDD